MKKIYKRISIVLCIIFVFSAPSSVLATVIPQPVCTFTYSDSTLDWKIYEYQPTPYSLSLNVGIALPDTTSSDKYWHVPAGNQVHFTCTFTSSGVSKIKVYEVTGTLQFTLLYDYDYKVLDGNYFDLPSSSTDKTYMITIECYSNLGFSISGYSMAYQR